MAYGYTLLAPYFELDETSPARRTPAICRTPPVRPASPVAPVGGYVLGHPANLPERPHRARPPPKALIAFTSPEAQKLYVQNGSRTAPRYSVGADPGGAPAVADLRGGRCDVLARRTAVLAAPADPADQRHHPDLRRGAARHAARQIIAAKALQKAQKRAEAAMRTLEFT
jgi:multiple sugar transport system substrate-binding protein